MRVGIYEDLLAMNEAAEQFTKRVEKLRDAEMLTPHYAELRILAAQHNCAEVNASVANNLVKPEMDDAHRIQKELIEKETKLASSQDG